MLSRLAREFAAEIRYQDWSDAHTRLDRAGHRREHDPNAAGHDQLDATATDAVRTNVFWVVAQVLKHEDPNLDLYEFASACGVSRDHTHTRNGQLNGTITAGIRFTDCTGDRARPPVLLENEPDWTGTFD
ncbi:hypothetical protein GB931_04530 [Modestobacter sp. I12A-02628]|uniref:Uncharacterized protein n=1 Tax=Goekera deserti TaxID=2497753 RepID=A0A7K3WDN7_9ACTN|nr:hypothetical protein [Goekera deserti]MPQ97204.1 hypothetical protein [Goekera deserti]NDI46478.1 hypothetical protein [Goekera deserti]NEL54588.1 hypothetical protein [Goekera deserti]